MHAKGFIALTSRFIQYPLQSTSSASPRVRIVALSSSTRHLRPVSELRCRVIRLRREDTWEHGMSISCLSYLTTGETEWLKSSSSGAVRSQRRESLSQWCWWFFWICFSLTSFTLFFFPSVYTGLLHRRGAFPSFSSGRERLKGVFRPRYGHRGPWGSESLHYWKGKDGEDGGQVAEELRLMGNMDGCKLTSWDDAKGRL